jgi:hypothetical protein
MFARVTFALLGAFAYHCATADRERDDSPARKSGCTRPISAQIRVDSGHPWRPPFGLERVGGPIAVHVELIGQPQPAEEYAVAAYRGGQEIERHSLRITGVTLPPVGTAQFALLPQEVALLARCSSGGRIEELKRQPVSWPDIEADAQVSPDYQINPVDLGAILVPYDWLLLKTGQSAVISIAAISRTHDIANARVRAWFDGSRYIEAPMPLAKGRRITQKLRLPLLSSADSTTLHISLISGGRERWKKLIHSMVVPQVPRWPIFGAVETKLRYDAPISVNDPRSGVALPSVDYDTAWSNRLNDIVVFLPNGARFVFWRGSSYVPFWAGRYNTGLSYQWAETIAPPGFLDAVEPLQDKDLRYSRVSIIESSASRVHVRWTYQSVDFTYKSLGDEATEDFYFYPDGFGTRVVTLASTRPEDYVYSEFIVLLPQSAIPFEVLHHPRVDMLFLDGEQKRMSYPLLPGSYGELTLPLPGEQSEPPNLHPVERLLAKVMEYQKKPGTEVTSAQRALVNDWLGKVSHPRDKSIIYRIVEHEKDSLTSIYFSPHAASSTIVFLPFYDRGELVTPAYWGDHWPLGRGALTGGAISERIYRSPSHLGLMDLSEPAPLFSSQYPMLDTFGRLSKMTLERRAWLIGKSDASDQALLEWAQSYSQPPSIEVKGARIDFPSYSPERRALRLVVEADDVEIKLTPGVRTINPVFELDQAPKYLASVTVDSEPLPADAYAWDGATLWTKGRISPGATFALHFHE